jgi:thermitase
VEVVEREENANSSIAVVSPAGNEGSTREYWPAAHPDVIGVASSNRMGNARASWSNWGSWVNCCTRGQDVFSTYVNWDGLVQGEPGSPENFTGWARWDGTSFAAPKVAAAIACELANSQPGTSPVTVYEGLVGQAVTKLTDPALAPGVPIPYLHIV